MKSYEQRLLIATNSVLDHAASQLYPELDRTDARLNLLEAVASIVGGWSLKDFWELFGRSRMVVSADLIDWATKVRTEIESTPIPVPLALSSLSREVLAASKQKRTGAYYTDWRLAQQLARDSVACVTRQGPWIDTACGTGVLLVAAAMEVSRENRDEVIADLLVGADLSQRALRGALLSVASLTSDLKAVQKFSSRLLAQDSLRSSNVWRRIAPSGAALVIGNPPWEKLRVTKHELAKRDGVVRAYGTSFDEEVDLAEDRSRLLAYVEEVVSGTQLQGRGEHDLYKLFLEMGIGLTSDRGVLALILPAGLIRSQGTEDLRRELNAVSRDLNVAVIENRASNFAIDTRFKFVNLVATIGVGRRSPITLKVADRKGKLPLEPVSIDRSLLEEIRGDFSIPEIRTTDEWKLYSRLAADAVLIGAPDGPWRPRYLREVDMTSDRRHFLRDAVDGTVPLIEGRHVSQYRWRSKTFRSGEGRSAIWRPEPLRNAQLRTQWHMPVGAMKSEAKERMVRSRVGFCDITGQTNERSLLVARIPAGAVCGNKVPTVLFRDNSIDREDLFLALGNSLVVDWMLRRIVTTTVNFFLLDSLQLPPIDLGSVTARQLVNLVRLVSSAEGDPNGDLWEIGQWRARIDALVADAWGLDVDDMEIVLGDFPLLDRGQPSLGGEPKSTITRDCVLAHLAKLQGERHWAEERCKNAQAAGALPYIPAEFARS